MAPNRIFFSDAGINRVNPDSGESDVFTHPRMDPQDGTYRGCIFSHGAGGLAQSLFDRSTISGVPSIGQALCGIFPLCSADFGYNNWGNDEAVSLIGNARDLLIQRGAADAPMLIAAGSMGNLSSLRYIVQNQEDVAGYIGFIPALSNTDIRTRVPSSRADQDVAWGITYPEPFPEVDPSADPIDFASEIEVPVLIIAASNDPICSFSICQDFVDSVSGPAKLVNVGPLGHSNEAIYAGMDEVEWWISRYITNKI